MWEASFLLHQSFAPKDSYYVIQTSSFDAIIWTYDCIYISTNYMDQQQKDFFVFDFILHVEIQSRNCQYNCLENNRIYFPLKLSLHIKVYYFDEKYADCFHLFCNKSFFSFRIFLHAFVMRSISPKYWQCVMFNAFR